MTWTMPFSARDCQDVAELDPSVSAGLQALHTNHIAGRHPVLLATGADDRVHTYASVQIDTGRAPARSGEPADFSVLAVFRVGALSNHGGRLQSGTAATGKRSYSSVRQGRWSNQGDAASLRGYLPCQTSRILPSLS